MYPRRRSTPSQLRGRAARPAASRPGLRAGSLTEDDPKREDIHRLIVALSFGNTGEQAVRFGPISALHCVWSQVRPEPRARARRGSVGVPLRLWGQARLKTTLFRSASERSHEANTAPRSEAARDSERGTGTGLRLDSGTASCALSD